MNPGDTRVREGFRTLLVVGFAIVAIGACAEDVAATPGQTIPGLAAVDVYGNLRKQGMTCKGPRLLRTRVYWTCSDSSAIWTLDATVQGRSPTAIELVNAMETGTYGPTPSVGVDFLAFVATLPYTGAQPARAQQWVRAHVRGGGTTVIARVRFTIYARAPRARLLTIKPA